jgi:hypothetical protein
MDIIGGILAFGAFILCTLMAVGLGIAFMKAVLGGGSTKRLRHMDHQEVQDFQELERGFRRMEERLDALETLLIGPRKSSIPERERDPEFDV